MPWGWSFLRSTFNFNLQGSDVEITKEFRYDSNRGWAGLAESEINYVHAGADVRLDLIRFDAGNAIVSGTLAGPSACLELGCKSNRKGSGIGAMVELSAVRAETSVGPLCLSGNLNLNTGARLGTNGVEVNFLGWGLTLGVNGKFTINSWFGSAGFCKPGTMRGTMVHTYSAH